MKRSNPHLSLRTLALTLTIAALALALASCVDRGVDGANSDDAKKFLRMFDGNDSTIPPVIPPNTTTYTVTFNSNNGSSVSSQTVAKDGYVSQPTNPTRIGYTFEGWYSNSGLTTQWYFDVNTVNANTTLYAKWTQTPVTPNTVTLTVSKIPADGGTVNVNGTATQGTTTHNSGATVTVTATAASGYRFSEWTGASSATTPSVTITMDANKTLTANFTAASNPSVPDGPGLPIIDSRGAVVEEYKTVFIGGYRWIARNLNYTTATTITDSSWCYEDSPDSCAKYGRLYNWYAALYACPYGWHLPDTAEWNALVRHAGGSAAGTTLKSAIGWDGTDDYGFSAMPGGYRYDDVGSFYDVGSIGFWWSATEGGYGAYIRGMVSDNDNVYEDTDGKSYGFSVRCAQDCCGE